MLDPGLGLTWLDSLTKGRRRKCEVEMLGFDAAALERVDTGFQIPLVKGKRGIANLENSRFGLSYPSME